jgi:hypothetical protein
MPITKKVNAGGEKKKEGKEEGTGARKGLLAPK